ncbi:hypothetical protein [Streptomyces sp. NPDC059171]|uniref:hypothetical protein n=1 Tax=Streptomyces sp. NPDC059171 TaxID=3346755 RepID=UPI00369992DC
MIRFSILTFAPAPSPAAEPDDHEYVASSLVTVDRIPTRGGAAVHIHQDSDGTLSSDCTGCGEYAWTLAVTRDFARAHAATCFREPRPLRSAA